MGKLLSRVVTVLAVVFLGYMLLSGQVGIAWERVIIYLIIAGGVYIAGGVLGRQQKKQDESFFKGQQGNAAPAADMDQPGGPDSILYTTDTGQGGPAPIQGVVRTSAVLTGAVIFCVGVVWVLLAFLTFLAAMDGAFAETENLQAFGMLFAVVVLLTAALLWLVRNFCCQVYYTPQGVTVKRGRSSRQYAWSEIADYTQHNYLYIFRNREGKKLFFTNSSYEGFDGFFAQYSRTRGGA